MRRIALAALVVVESVASAEPQWVFGGQSPPLTTFGSLEVGDRSIGVIGAFALHGGVQLDRLAVIVESEFDIVSVNDRSDLLVRLGADLRLSLWRQRGEWKHRPPHRHQLASDYSNGFDVFVDAGIGNEWISGSSLALNRRDVELGVGVSPGIWVRSYDVDGRTRSRSARLFVRLRVIAARSPALDVYANARCTGSCAQPATGHDLGVMFDVGVVGDGTL